MKKTLIMAAVALLLGGCADPKIGTTVKSLDEICNADKEGNAKCYLGPWNFDITRKDNVCVIDGYFQNYGTTRYFTDGAITLYFMDGLRYADYQRLGFVPGKPRDGKITVHRDFTCPERVPDGYSMWINFRYRD